jgi:acyl-CoA synthetase (AMP-forming)/AMP-acid ligase II
MYVCVCVTWIFVFFQRVVLASMARQVERMQKFGRGKLPTVRFGSTETCLQVCGTPCSLTDQQRLEAFQRGWSHTVRTPATSTTTPPTAAYQRKGSSSVDNGDTNGDDDDKDSAGFEEVKQAGYYIGRSHPPFTECVVVRGVDPSDVSSFMVPCAEGVAGLLVTRGANIMSGYANDPAATTKALVLLHGDDHGNGGNSSSSSSAASSATSHDQSKNREGARGKEGEQGAVKKKARRSDDDTNGGAGGQQQQQQQQPWYTNLGDVCFWLRSPVDGVSEDLYWLSRQSSLLIRGGANYAYDQVEKGQLSLSSYLLY